MARLWQTSYNSIASIFLVIIIYMARTSQVRNIDDIDPDEGYRMSMAEFKGSTINALQYINRNIEVMQAQQTNLQNQLNNQKLLAAVIGGVSGILTAIFSPIRVK